MRIALVGGSLLFVLAVLLIVINLNPDPPSKPDDPLDPTEFTELVLPGLTDEERRRAAERSQTDDEEISIRLEQGGWTTIFETDSDNQRRLSQRYTAERLDPLPDRRMEMIHPHAQLFLANDRIVAMTADRAQVKRGLQQRLESGRMTGNVVIRVFEPRDGVAPDPARDRPSIIIRTEEADLNHLDGEIRCDGEIEIESDVALFAGEQMSILYSPRAGIERLFIARSKPIRIFGSAFDRADSPTTSDASSPPPRDSDAPSNARARTPSEAGSGSNNTAASPPARATATMPTESANREHRFYRATCHEAVWIERGPLGRRQIITGDQLDIIFSMNNSDLGTTVSQRTSTSSPRRAESFPPTRSHHAQAALLVASLAFGLVGQDTDARRAFSDDDIIVRFDGPLVLVPTTARGDQLASSNDIRMTLTGRPVRVIDEAQQAEANAGRAVYESENATVRLIGDESFPLVVAGPDLHAEGEVFVYATEAQLGRFVGPGTMVLSPREHEHDEAPRADDEGLDIRWSRGVELHFARDPEAGNNRGGRLRLATFKGDVVVRNVGGDDRFTMNSEELTVAFVEQAARGEGERENVRYIEARGGVIVAGLDQSGSTLAGERLRLDFEWSEQLAKSSPRKLVIEGEAEASDSLQSIAANKLTVMLLEQPRDPNAPPAERRSNVEIETLLAEERVRVLMRSGLTVTGDRLFAVTGSEHAEVTGLPVRIVGKEETTDFVVVGSHALIDRFGEDYRVRMDGAGHLRMKNAGRGEQPDQPLQPLPVEGRIIELDENGQAPPAPDRAEGTGGTGGEEFEVEWTDSLQYDEFPSRRRARIDVRGKVKAVSQPTLVEESTVNGERIVLELDLVDPVPKEPVVPADAAAPAREGAFAGERRLRSFIANGAPAKVESRVWLRPDRRDAPRVHYIEGKYIALDAHTRNAEVRGDGRLLVQDMTSPGPGEPKPDFGTRGATLFEWKGGMMMKELVDGRYDITMSDTVSMLHRGLDGDTATLQSPRLEVAAKKRSSEISTGGLDFGGSLQLLRFAARASASEPLGRSRLEAQGRTIEASEIDYNYETALMQIRGAPRNPALFAQQGQIGSTRAEEILWDMRGGTVRFRDAGASGVR